MILEINTDLLEIVPGLTISQLVFLNILINENQKNHQDVYKLLSLVSEAEIEDLEKKNLIDLDMDPDGNRVIEKSKTLEEFLKEDETMFDQFYNEYPVYVMRPDGTKGFLRSNINKCRKEYNKTVGKSKAMHQHIMDCLRFEVNNKMMTGKLGYMKTMWKWITNHEWEAIEDQMNEETLETNTYGTELL